MLDLAPQQGLERAWQQLNSGQRAGRESRFENEALAFHKKVRAGYLELAKLEPQRFRIIDAGQSADHVFAEIHKTLAPFLK